MRTELLQKYEKFVIFFGYFNISRLQQTISSNYRCFRLCHRSRFVTRRKWKGQTYPFCFQKSIKIERKVFSTRKKEMLAICWALQTFRNYLYGARFKIFIITDHPPLTFSLSPNESDGRRIQKNMTTKLNINQEIPMFIVVPINLK